MSKISIMSLADIHLSGGFDTDEARALSKAADIAIERKVNAVLVLGDVYHSASAPEQRLVFKDFLEQLAAHQIDVVVLRGNHDAEQDLMIFDKEEFVNVFERPGMIKLSVVTPDLNPDASINIHCIPHFNASALADKLESQSEMGEQGTGLFDDLLNGIYQEIHSSPSPSIVAFHGTVTGAHLDNGMIPKHDGIVLNGELLGMMGCLVRGGHYHKPQDYYCGSLTLRNYGESGDRGVIIDTWDGEKWLDMERVSLQPVQRITINAAFVNGVFNFDLFPDDLKGARVRLRYTVKQSEVPQVNLDDVRKFFNNQGVLELKIERALIVETAVRSEAIHQASTVLDMHLLWLEQKGLMEQIANQTSLYNAVINPKKEAI